MIRKVALADVLEAFETGKRPKGGAIAEGIPSLGGEHVTAEGTLKLDSMKFVPLDFYESMSKGRLRVGDVLVVKDGATTGRVGRVDENFPFDHAGVNEHLFLLRADQRCLDPRFLYFYLRSAEGQAELMSDFRGAAQGGISREIGDKVRIPLLPLDEQRRIVDLLSRAEGIVRLRRETQKKAAEIIPALFLDMFSDPARKAKGLVTIRLADIAEVVSGITKGRKLNGRTARPVPYLRVANVQAGFLNLDEMKEIEATDAEIETLELRRGDIVLTEGGDFDKLGRGAQWSGEIPTCIHQNHVFRVRLRSEVVVPDYFEAYLQTSAAKSYFLSVAKRTTNLASINMTQLRSLPVLLPPVALQRQFAERVAATRSILTIQDSADEKAKAGFNALLNRAFSGGKMASAELSSNDVTAATTAA